MYAPLLDALNLGLDALSEIEVNGLPKFQNRILFVPLDEGVTSYRDLEGYLFKPDIVLMPLTTACDFLEVKGTRSLRVSQPVSKIPKKTRSKVGPPKPVSPKNVPSKRTGPHAGRLYRCGSINHQRLGFG